MPVVFVAAESARAAAATLRSSATTPTMIRGVNEIPRCSPDELSGVRVRQNVDIERQILLQQCYSHRAQGKGFAKANKPVAARDGSQPVDRTTNWARSRFQDSLAIYSRPAAGFEHLACQRGTRVCLGWTQSGTSLVSSRIAARKRRSIPASVTTASVLPSGEKLTRRIGLSNSKLSTDRFKAMFHNLTVRSWLPLASVRSSPEKANVAMRSW